MQVLIIFALLFIKAALAVPMARTTLGNNSAAVAFTAILLCGAFLHVLTLAPLIPPEENENTVPEEYIVVFKKAATELNG